MELNLTKIALLLAEDDVEVLPRKKIFEFKFGCSLRLALVSLADDRCILNILPVVPCE